MTKQKFSFSIVAGICALLFAYSGVNADQNPVTPSTNDINRANGWAHYNVLDIRNGEVDIQFVSTREFWSCFEYRVDDEPPISNTNPNPDIHDGVWLSICVYNQTEVLTLTVQEHVDIRSVFGYDGEERFDWTRVDASYDVQTKRECKKGGWQDFGFINQGQCIRFVNTKLDSRVTQQFDPATTPVTTTDCARGGWANYGFARQHHCNRFVNNGLDSRIPGDVDPTTIPMNKRECRKNGWQDLGFMNQGQCWLYVDYKHDSRGANQPDPSTTPITTSDCRQGGWRDFGFSRQTYCFRFVNTGQDNR